MGVTAGPVQESRRAVKCGRYGPTAGGAPASRIRAVRLEHGTGPAGSARAAVPAYGHMLLVAERAGFEPAWTCKDPTSGYCPGPR